MADSAAATNPPRIERLTLWAIALDVIAVLVGVGVPEAVLFVFLTPLILLPALVLSIRSAVIAERGSARVIGWATVVISALLLLLWAWVIYYEHVFPLGAD